MKRLLVLTVLGIFTSHACAQSSGVAAESLVDTKKSLFELCTSPKESATFGACVFYLRGFIQGMLSAETNDGRKSKTLCIPQGITVGGIVDDFVRVAPTLKGPLESKAMSYDPGTSATTVLTAAFPCKD
jgi:hypothetical protein